MSTENKTMSFWEKVSRLQYEVTVSKNRQMPVSKNRDGTAARVSKYRDKEDIIAAVKDPLNKYGLLLYTESCVVEMGGRLFIKSTATVTDGENRLQSSGFAELADERLTGAKLTGAATTYAERYALCGLLLVCDHTPNLENNPSNEDDPPSGGGSPLKTLDDMALEYDKGVLMPLYDKFIVSGRPLAHEEKKVLYTLYKKYIPDYNTDKDKINTNTVFERLDSVFEFGKPL